MNKDFGRGRVFKMVLRWLWVMMGLVQGLYLVGDPNSFSVQVEGGVSAPMKLYLGVLGSGKERYDCSQLTRLLVQCLSFEKLFDIKQELLSSAPTKKSDVTHLFDKGFDAALFVTFEDLNSPVEWRLYDTQPGEMISGKRQAILGYVKDVAFGVAARVMKELISVEAPFLSKIAFIERDRKKKKSLLTLVDYDGSSKQVLLSSARILVAPSWSLNREKPFLIVSEFTPSNVRFMGVDMEGKKYVLLDLEGTNVGISYGAEGRDVVYCRSGAIWSYQYNPETKRGVHRCLIREQGTCASPSLTEDGDIVFCSEGKIKCYHVGSKRTSMLTPKGYNVAPAYSRASGQIVYSTRIRGAMQLFTYDLKTKNMVQLTHDRGDKVDPCWSPCGRYCVFCWENNIESRIAVLSIATKEYWFITPMGRCCRYPAWSPIFDKVILA
ncbi:MAG: Protein TolB [candidate division TM6 bacterium GW2011_GWF2_43_87]|nr:MAG: Protein TolB [candidate division TM6 bacterium GW2011_GWF2_43_87]